MNASHNLPILFFMASSMVPTSFHQPKALPTSYIATAIATNATTTHVNGFFKIALATAKKLAAKPIFAISTPNAPAI